MTIVHIVLFKFKPSASEDDVKQACARMLALKDTCIHPQSGDKYVRSYGGGKDNSPEGQQGGFTHGFVSEFETAEDRDYYLNKDPAHLSFVASLEGIIEGARILDYTPGTL